MTDIEWGPAIAVDGERPEWLDENSKVDLKSVDGTRWYSEGASGLGVGTEHIGWQHVKLIRLPADHPHYRQTEAAIPESMKAWTGGDKAPEDWAGPGSRTIGRLGQELNPGAGPIYWRWASDDDRSDPDLDIVAYTPKAEAKPDLTAEAASEALALVKWMDEKRGQHADYYTRFGFEAWVRAAAIVALLPEPVDPLEEAKTVLDVFLAAYQAMPDTTLVERGPGDDLLTYGHLRTILRALALAGEKEA